MRVFSRRCSIACLALVGLVVASCGDDDSAAPTSVTAPATSTQTTSTQTTSGPTTTAPGIDPLEGASTDPVEVPAPGGMALLTRVEAARHEGYDRVVFEFTGARPGYRVSYEPEPVTEDASGKEVAVAGDFVVVVRMEPASGVDQSGSAPVQTFLGPTRFTPGTPEVAEIVQLGDYEAVLTWAIGLHDRVDFRVTTLHNPERLVIDFRNH